MSREHGISVDAGAHPVRLGLFLVVGLSIPMADVPAQPESTDLQCRDPIRTTTSPAEPALADRLRCLVRAPGLAIAIADSTGIRSHASGWAMVEHRVPVRQGTRFRLASTSKVVTAVALASLADRGVIDLDRPIGTYMPDLPAHVRPITPRQLAGHLGGIRHYQPKDSIVDLRHFDTTREALDHFLRDSLHSAPGTEYAYSTFGYTLLGAVMEEAADRSLVEIIRTKVAAPLRLETLGPDEPRRLVPGRTGFYERAGPSGTGELRRAEYVDPSYKLAGGGLLASAGDLARLGQALLQGELRLSDRVRSALFSSQTTNDGEKTGVGLGWRVGTDPFGRNVWHHEGSTGGARSALLLYPDENVAIALLSNLTVTPYFAFETAAALAASRLASRDDHECAPEEPVTFRGTAAVDGHETEARLRLRPTRVRVEGTLELGKLPLPVDPLLPVVDGWCRDDWLVLVLGIGPNFGFVPITLEPSSNGWGGAVELQGGHSLDLRVRPH